MNMTSVGTAFKRRPDKDIKLIKISEEMHETLMILKIRLKAVSLDDAIRYLINTHPKVNDIILGKQEEVH